MRHRAARGTKVSNVASGGHANRAGANGDVPSPADTWSHADSWWESPFTRARSMPQLVTRAP